jgi:cytochrome P450
VTDVALPPGPKNAAILRELPRFRRGVLAYLAELSRRYDDPVVHLQFGPGASFIVNHPDVVKEFLVRVPERFSRSRWLGELRKLVGAGLLFSDEETWVRQRRRLRPAYARGHAEVVDAATRAETEALADEWRAAPGAVVDVQEDGKRVLLRALVRIMFSPEAPVDDRQTIADLDAVLQFVGMRSTVIRQNLGHVGIRWGEATVRGALARLDAFIADLIDGTRSGRYSAGLLLATLLEAEARGEVDAQNLHDEIGTLLVAGFDTTSALVTFALWSLAARPDLADAVRTEAEADDRPVLEAVLRETLRLYPPVWAIHRTATEDIELGGFTVPKGEHVMASPFALQRNPRWWAAPDAFAPERFFDAPDNDALLGMEYLPFSHGRHTCIGKRMALQQARLMVAELMSRFEIEQAGPPPRLVPGVIIRAADGLPLRVTPR